MPTSPSTGTPSPPDEGIRFGRGCLAGLVLAAVLVLLVVAILVSCTSGPARLPREPDPRPSTPATSASEVDSLIAVEWEARRYGCGTPTQIVVDGIAPVLVDELHAPALDARIAVGRWRDRIACPGR